jgi:hypothetical protein
MLKTKKPMPELLELPELLEVLELEASVPRGRSDL